jgi:ADP-ribose pyrophosphatase YjhB (NUDIX family)
MKTRGRKSIDAPLMAAGGIVLVAGRSPLIALVQRRKDGGWVLPRGKLRPKESALTAARREVERETGHSVVVREFLGTISYESGGRPKIIQFWLMASLGHAGQELMGDAKTVKWLSLNAAVATLTEPLEQSFLAQIGKQRHDKFRKWLNGRQAPRLRANGRTGEGPRKERVKTHDRSSNAPSFIRKFFRRLKNPRPIPNRGGVFSR